MLYLIHHSFFQEILIRTSAISGWTEELDYCIRERMPTVANRHIRNIIELEAELQKLISWWDGLTLVESFFRQ